MSSQRNQSLYIINFETALTFLLI